LVGALDVDLDERAGELLLLPRSGGFTRAQADDHVLQPRRLAGVQGHGLDDPVALVEHAQHRDPLRHRRDAGGIDRGGCGRGGTRRPVLRLLAAPASGERDGEQQRNGGGAAHFYSGIHGS
jgi:hypothetical protein